MQPLFTSEGLAALDAVLRRAPLLAFDFDGTLAPIVDRPDDACMAPEVAERLALLAARRPVAVVTGRTVADVLPRLGFVPRHVVGSHGAEDGGEGGDGGAIAATTADADAGPAAASPAGAVLDAVRRHVQAAADELRALGVQVEDKGLSLALHYRQAPDRTAASARIDALVAGLDPGFRHFGGKCVVNVVAADAPDKGDAVRALVARSGAGAAVFVGDDVNDEAVFATAPPHWLTVRVGRDAASAAAFFVDDQPAVAALLAEVLARSPEAGEAP